MSLNMAELVSAARQELTTAKSAGNEPTTEMIHEFPNKALAIRNTNDDRCLVTESRQISVIMSTSEMLENDLDNEARENEELTEDSRKKPYGGRPLKFQCPHCERRFHAPSHLKRHVMSHSSERPYRCDVCGKGFLQAWHLGRHMTTHTGNKPFRCTECPKSFGSRFEMKTHINYIHKGIKEHQCSVCGKYFTLRSNLKVHMRKHTGEKPYQCNYCCKRFGQRGHLQYHIRKHTGSTDNFLKVLPDLEESKTIPSSPVALASPPRASTISISGDYCHDDATSVDSDKDSGVGGCDFDENSSTTSSCHSPTLRDFDEQQISCDNRFAEKTPFVSSNYNSSPEASSDLSLRAGLSTSEIKPYVCQSCNCGFAEVSSLRAHVRHSHPRKGILRGDYKCGLCLKDFLVIDDIEIHVLRAHGDHKLRPAPATTSQIYFPTLKRQFSAGDESKNTLKLSKPSEKAQAFSIESLCKKDSKTERPSEKRSKSYICTPLPYRYTPNIYSLPHQLPWYSRGIDKLEASRSLIKYYDHLALVQKYGCDSLCPLLSTKAPCFQIY